MVKKKSTKKTRSSKKSTKKVKKSAAPKAAGPSFEKTNIKIKDVDIDHETKNLMWIIIAIVAVFALFFLIRFIIPSSDGTPSIDELHELNLKGELDDNASYVYKGFSFLKMGEFWYTQLQKGNTIFDVTLNYGPRDVEHIPVEGSLAEGFIESEKFYITFDPEGDDLRYIAVANYGLSNSLVRAFGFDLTAGCSKNVTEDCATAQIITCDDEDKQVFFFKEDEEAKVIFDDNCVIIQGSGTDIVKAKDRLLLRWYNILR